MTKECSEIKSSSLIKVEENGRKAVFKNPERKKYIVATVDDCLITEGIRCDYLISEIGVASAFVELKGTDVKHAVAQILETIKHPKIKPLTEEKFGCLIVCSKYPRIDTTIQKAKNSFSTQYNAGLHVVCGKGEFNITEVSKINGKVKG